VRVRVFFGGVKRVSLEMFKLNTFGRAHAGDGLLDDRFRAH